MSTRGLALSAADAVSEEDYQTLLSALSATARGRAFLGEHVRRHRQADTAALLQAVERIEAQLASQPTKFDVAQELSAVIESVQGVRSQIDAVQLTAAVTQLAATLDGVQQRLPALATRSEPAAPRAHEQALEPPAGSQPMRPQFALALTAVAAQAIAAAEEEPVKVIKAGTIPSPSPFAGEDFAAAANSGVPAYVSAGQTEHDNAVVPTGAGYDVMMQIMALSEEERLALFS